MDTVSKLETTDLDLFLSYVDKHIGRAISHLDAGLPNHAVSILVDVKDEVTRLRKMKEE